MIRQSFNYKHFNISHRSSFESLVMRSPSKHLPLLVVLYRPPAGNLTEFIDDFSDFLTKIFLCDRPLLIVGDFNIHIDDPGDSQARTFLERINTFGLVQHVRQATHSGGHILDLVLTKDLMPTGLSICPLTISDHCSVSFDLGLPVCQRLLPELILRRDLISLDQQKFLQNLHETGVFKTPTAPAECLDTEVDFLNCKLKCTLDKLAPLKVSAYRVGVMLFCSPKN